MQYFGANFSPMRVGEMEVFTVDFATTNSLATGETITSSTWTIKSVDGGVVPNGMLPGPGSIVGTVCSMYLSAVAAGLFLPLCTVTTSRGQTLTLPDVGAGQLAISL
jgi:hypothetical protein